MRHNWVLIACAEEVTKAWAAMAAPGGGCGDVGTTGRPNARGFSNLNGLYWLQLILYVADGVGSAQPGFYGDCCAPAYRAAGAATFYRVLSP